MAIIIVLLFIGFFLLLLGRKEILPEEFEKEKNESGILVPFYRAAAWICRKMGNNSLKKTEEKFRILEPAYSATHKAREHFIRKTGLAFLVLVVGFFLVFFMEIKSKEEGVLEEGNRIQRNEFSEGEITAYFSVGVSEENVENIEVTVAERSLREEEIKALLPDFYQELEREILGQNASFDCVDSQIMLVENLEGYPFNIQWQISDTKVLDREGYPSASLPEEGKITELEATITYEDFNEIYVIPLMVYPGEESLLAQIQKRLEEENEKSKGEEYFQLPTEVEGMQISWTEEKKNHSIVLLVLSVVAAIGIFWGKEQDLYKRLEERKKQMEDDYPEIVSKITLYIGAGMTVRGAWKKLAFDYRKRKEEGGKVRYAYEEMLFTVYEWESGIEEMIAYQHFSRRCGVQRYVKFVALLEQNVRMGAKGLLSTLRRESQEAFEERKRNAEKKGEEAGTKLLIPMFLMLLIVMVVIMVPAMMTMG